MDGGITLSNLQLIEREEASLAKTSASWLASRNVWSVQSQRIC